MNAAVMRRILAALFISGLGWGLSPARAQDGPVDVTPKSPAQALACLERQAPLPAFPQRGALDRDRVQIRVLLRFEKPDAAPRVQVLMSDTSRNDVHDLVDRYLAGYRLPCLTPADGVVSAVQEFSFDNSQRAPLPFDEEDREVHRCLVVPPLNQRSAVLISSRPARVLVQIRFTGDGDQDPEVQVIYATRGEREFTRYVTNHALRYTMPCRKATDKPVVLEQVYVYAPAGAPRMGFAREVMGLAEFLSLTQAPERLEAEFDLNSMGCPFKVNFENRRPFVPNQVRGGPPNPNRTAFLKWIEERQLNFSNDKQAVEFFGSTLQIDIPCGVLSLHPEAAAAGS